MERRDLLRRLRGAGLEIGAHTYPLPLPPGAAVRYGDLLTVEEDARALIAHVGGFEEEAWTPLEDEREFVFLLRASG